MSKKRKRFPLSFSFDSGEVIIRHNGRPVDGIRAVSISRDFGRHTVVNIEAVISPLRKK